MLRDPGSLRTRNRYPAIMDAQTLPSHQHRYEDLPRLSEEQVHARREGVFLLLSGLFLGTLTMLNILGITRFIKLFEIDFDRSDPGVTAFAVAIGVLPYPITFLCTDFISELYGRRRASMVVWMGLVLNIWVIAILWFGGSLPGFEDRLADGSIEPDAAGRMPVFFEVRALAFGAVTASMIAYLIAQFVDVYVFHFWKNLTKGKHLWLRNNGSTMVSQLVDTIAVILLTYFVTSGLDEVVDPAKGSVKAQLLALIVTGYVFKFLVALLDTIPFVLGAPRLARFLRLPPAGHWPSPGRPAAVEAGVG